MISEKWEPVFGDHVPQKAAVDGDSKKSHPVLVAVSHACIPSAGATRTVCSGVLEALGHHPAALGKLLHDLFVQPDVHFC
jgi:hypothetical protein